MFHLAIPVKDVESTLNFYRDQLGFEINLIEKHRCILNFFGHQLVAHVSKDDVPVKPIMYPRHFGIIFDSEADFESLYQKAKQKNLPFFEECFTRFEGTRRAHRSFFLKDESNNLLEFKWYQDPEMIFFSEK